MTSGSLTKDMIITLVEYRWQTLGFHLTQWMPLWPAKKRLVDAFIVDNAKNSPKGHKSGQSLVQLSSLIWFAHPDQPNIKHLSFNSM